MAMSPSRPTDLPDFGIPPVIEVVLGIQFDPIPGFTTSHVGLLWRHFRDQFPRTEDKAPLESVREEFGPPRPQLAPLRLEFLEGPPAPRTWFLKGDGTELVQLQRDRIVHNWRKVGIDAEYPRYEPIKETFRQDVLKLETGLRECELPLIRPNQWEVTYVNHIRLPLHSSATEFGQLQGVIAPWTGQYSDEFLEQPEDVQFSARYTIYGASRNPIGRLHIAAQPGLQHEDGAQIVILTLTARGRPSDPSVAAAFDGLDIGRVQIVRGFTSVTTQDAHRAWGRRDA
jgi:uncharacterized protein (TIGR04255 family)